jgi:hypothetical protein
VSISGVFLDFSFDDPPSLLVSVNHTILLCRREKQGRRPEVSGSRQPPILAKGNFNVLDEAARLTTLNARTPCTQGLAGTTSAMEQSDAVVGDAQRHAGYFPGQSSASRWPPSRLRHNTQLGW